MTDTTGVLLILVGLHLMESCQVSPEGAVALVRGMLRRYGVRTPATMMRVRRGRFLFLNPLDPNASAFISGLPHVVLTPEGVVDAGPEEAQVKRRRPHVPWSAVGSARREGSRVICEGLGAIECGTARNARLWSRALREIRSAPENRRAALVQRFVRLRLSTAIARRRVERVRRACAPLEVVSSVLFGVIVALGLRLALRPSPEWLLILLGTGGLAGIAIAVMHTVAHSRLYPGRMSEGLGRSLLMALCFPVAFRARSQLGRDALAHAHPVAAAVALGSPQSSSALIKDYARFWRYRSCEPQGDSADSRALKSAADLMLSAFKGGATEIGIDLQADDSPPSLRDETIRSWCPRCLATYVHAAGECADCPGVRLWATQSPSLATSSRSAAKE